MYGIGVLSLLLIEKYRSLAATPPLAEGCDATPILREQLDAIDAG